MTTYPYGVTTWDEYTAHIINVSSTEVNSSVPVVD